MKKLIVRLEGIKLSRVYIFSCPACGVELNIPTRYEARPRYCVKCGAHFDNADEPLPF